VPDFTIGNSQLIAVKFSLHVTLVLALP